MSFRRRAPPPAVEASADRPFYLDNIFVHPTDDKLNHVGGRITLKPKTERDPAQLCWTPYHLLPAGGDGSDRSLGDPGTVWTPRSPVHSGSASPKNASSKDLGGSGSEGGTSPATVPVAAALGGTTSTSTRIEVPVEPTTGEAAAMCIPLRELYSIRRNPAPSSKIPSISVVVRGGVELPKFYFHERRIKDFFAALKKYVPLIKSPDDHDLYLLDSRILLERSLSSLQMDEFQLDAPEIDASPAPGSPAPRDSVAWSVFDKFSKVTRVARDISKTIGATSSPSLGGSSSPRGRRDLRPGGSYRRGHSSSDSAFDERPGVFTDTEVGNFELITPATDSQPVPAVLINQRPLLEPLKFPVQSFRLNPLMPDQWAEYQDAEGRVADEDKVRNLVFHGGADPSIRAQVWKYLVGYWAFGSTAAERLVAEETRKTEYQILKNQWKTILPAQLANFSKFRERKHLIAKDVLRTDRDQPFYEGEDNPNLELLSDILITYTYYNWDIGYVQGMSDLLSPVLCLLDGEEHVAFWCFQLMMERLGRNFNRDQAGMRTQLEQMRLLVKHLDPALYRHLEEYDSTNMFFCFRWIIILFKREFAFGDILQVWEVVLSNFATDHFHLFVALAILESHREKIVNDQLEFDGLLKYINDLSGTIPVEETLQQAEDIFHAYKERPSSEPALKVILERG